MTPDSSTESQSTSETSQTGDSAGQIAGEGIGERGRQTGLPEELSPAEEIDWRGWLLVGAVLVSFLVIPAMILYIPAAQGFIGSLGLSMRQAYLTLPMIPAIILGVIAVWAAVQVQSGN